MDTINILDNYRKSILEDDSAMQILSLILLHGQIPQDKLISFIQKKSSASEVKTDSAQFKIIDLFKSNLIKRNDLQEWILTDISENVLSSIGVQNSVAKMLLNSLELSKSEYVFFQACLDFQESTNVSHKDTINILRTLIKFQPFWKSEFKKKYSLKDLNKKTLYAFILSLDDRHNSIGSDEYLDELKEFHVNSKFSYRTALLKNLTRNFKEISFELKESKKNLLWSNLCFHENIIKKKKEIEPIFYITTNRIFNTIDNKKPDSELHNIYSFITRPSANLHYSIDKIEPGFFNKLKNYSKENEIISFDIGSGASDISIIYYDYFKNLIKHDEKTSLLHFSGNSIKGTFRNKMANLRLLELLELLSDEITKVERLDESTQQKIKELMVKLNKQIDENPAPNNGAC